MEQSFEHDKMNYQTLGNSVLPLHTHIVSRPLLEPAPNEPLPWAYLEKGHQDDTAFAAARRLTAHGPWLAICFLGRQGREF